MSIFSDWLATEVFDKLVQNVGTGTADRLAKEIAVSVTDELTRRGYDPDTEDLQAG